MSAPTAAWVILAVGLTIIATWAFYTARRLDRLHIRLDRSRDALQSALDRRCAVIAATVPQLAPLARATEEVRLSPIDLASRLDREAELGARLAPLIAGAAGAAGSPSPVALRELHDADTRVMLALRFYNDAVGDTRALRLRPSVRTLHLGGTAALPEFAALGQLPIGG
ncbi:hypothetical protein [Corynebacterium bouchesdurhonense]|uniref:hypothetical protein n=1 Tax=Corynebacterium bouchesdurhonense TaxID=1720192 RepID=UPI00082C97C5|nr:hypothetical protein [Corynebacterium bouchesdurhonense]